MSSCYRNHWNNFSPRTKIRGLASMLVIWTMTIEEEGSDRDDVTLVSAVQPEMLRQQLNASNRFPCRRSPPKQWPAKSHFASFGVTGNSRSRLCKNARKYYDLLRFRRLLRWAFA